ncbi:MAG: hypothetical protein ACYC23_04525 [Limisphaerales bacterium]
MGGEFVEEWSGWVDRFPKRLTAIPAQGDAYGRIESHREGHGEIDPFVEVLHL